MFSREIKDSLVKTLKDLEISVSEKEIVLEHPADLRNGDYSSNIALIISSKLKTQSSKPKLEVQNFQAENPRALAEKVVNKWQKAGLPDCVEKVEVAGPGFINIWLNFKAFSSYLDELLKRDLVIGGFGEDGGVEGRKTLVIDYSAPNIAKPFGIGHLRSTNIGQAIYNLYKFLGWKVIGDNHLGDWGTQFGKLIFQIECKVQSAKCKVDKEEFLRNLTIEDLEKLYVEFHKEVETKPEMEEEARKWFKKLEEGDSEAKEIWQACVDISLKEFDRIYNLLGVKIDYAYGESFYLDKMGAALDDCRKKGILKESQGAQVVEIPGMKVPAMLVKSDGATTYLLRDLATVKYRIQTWQPDLIVYEVGADQTLHFQQLFNIAAQLGYGNLNMFVHIAHGLIRWKEGKFSTRKGMTIHLEEVLNEAVKKAENISLASKQWSVGPQPVAIDTAIAGQNATSDGNEKEKREKVAMAVGIGAIKYNDLKQNPKTDIIFDWEQILTLQGNSGPYLQYTYARTQSVLANSKLKLKTKNFNNEAMEQYNNEEISLLRTIYRFPEVITEAAEQFSPNLLCNFLFDLAQKFNLFYDKNRIIHNSLFIIQKENKAGKTENEGGFTKQRSIFRLALTVAVGRVLKNGLNLLGIEALERM